MVEALLESLESIGYTGPLLEEDGRLERAINDGLSDVLFIDLIYKLTEEIKSLLNLNEAVTKPSGPEDSETFHIEMRSFLTELHCYHNELLGDLLVLNQPGNRLILIDYLLSELMTDRLLKTKTEESSDFKKNNFEANPYDISANLAAILKVYDVNTPPPHVTPTMVLDKIITKTKDLVSSAPKGHLSTPLVTQPLSPEQWGTLDCINESLTKEYSVRRQMLLTRCTVTVQSFRWSDKIKDKDDIFTGVYQEKWSTMKERAVIPIARVLSAKQDLLHIERTNNATVRQHTQCDVNKVLIGSVPDRGGRPNETRPPPEMPGFKQRTEAPKERREGGRGGHGRGGGGAKSRVQGGWSQGGGANYQRSYSTGGGYMEQGGGGGGGGGGWEGDSRVVYDGRDQYGGGQYGGGQYGGGGRYDQGGHYGGYQGGQYGGYQGGGYGSPHQQYRGGGGRGRGGRGKFQHQHSSYY